MKRVFLGCVVLALSSVPALAGEYLMNDTGQTVYSLHVAFSEPVTITSFGDVLMTVDPMGESTTFTFSGGELETWGGHWLNWEPSSTSIIGIEWQGEEEERQSDWLYQYLHVKKDRYGTGPFSIPVYVSVPPDTAYETQPCIETREGVLVELMDLSTGIFAGQVEVEEVPAIIDLRLLWNGQAVTDWLTQSIDNSFQAITIGIPLIGLQEASRELQDGFRTALMPTDVFGRYTYGHKDDRPTREYIESTLLRISETGATDVFLASFFLWDAIDPLPRISTVTAGGTVAIQEEDLARFASFAHELGLVVTLRYHAVAPWGEPDIRPTLNEPQSAEWMEAFLKEYSSLMVEQAEIAARADVDVFMLQFEDAGLCIEGNEELWGEGIAELTSRLRDVFPGKLGYDLLGGEVPALLDGRLPAESLEQIDVFLIGNLLNRGGYEDSSVEGFSESFERILAHIVGLRALFGSRPVMLGCMPLSYEGFGQLGYVNAVVLPEEDEHPPDFLEQVRYLEGLLQYVSESRLFDGLVAGWVHWDDPFGPDLRGTSLAHMDLGMSIRNKPAEALLKRWFGGANQLQFPCADPPCFGSSLGSIAGQRNESEIGDEGTDTSILPEPKWNALASLLPSAGGQRIDDFQGSGPLIGGEYSYDSAERHDPGTDPTSFCDISIQGSAEERYMAISFAATSWLKFRLDNIPRYDASEYSGVEVTMWSVTPCTVDFELATLPESGGWSGHGMPAITLDETPKRYRIPFEGLDPTPTSVDLRSLFSLAFFPSCGAGTIYWDDLYLYKDEPS